MKCDWKHLLYAYRNNPVLQKYRQPAALTISLFSQPNAAERGSLLLPHSLILFSLNLPMGGMILLTVRTNSGFSYPGHRHIIYASALYTFYAFIQSIRSLIRFRRIGSPILSAAKVLNFIAAMMSLLALQTAMISRFCENSESFRVLMNALTGGGIWCTVVLLAVFLLLRSRKLVAAQAPSVSPRFR